MTYALLGVAVLAIPLAALLSAFFRSDGGEALAAIQAAGDPCSIAELAHMPIPDEQNAAAILRSVESEIRLLDVELAPFFRSPEWQTGRFTAASIPLVEPAFLRHASIWEACERAAFAPGYNSQLDRQQPAWDWLTSLVIWSGYRRTVTMRLRLRADYQLVTSRPREAWKTCQILFGLHRHFSKDPTVISYFVNLATLQETLQVTNRVLRAEKLSAESSAELDATLARLDSWDWYLWAIKSDRAFHLSYRADLAKTPPPSLFTRDRFDLFQFEQGFHNYLAFAEKRLAEAGVPPAAVWEWSRYSGLPNSREFERYRQPHLNTLAEIRCLRVLNALLQAGLAGDVGDLDRLDLPAEATTDPFNSQPIRIRKTPNGPVIYAAGPNGADDGGMVNHFGNGLDTGMGPTSSIPAPSASNSADSTP